MSAVKLSLLSSYSMREEERPTSAETEKRRLYDSSPSILLGREESKYLTERLM